MRRRLPPLLLGLCAGCAGTPDVARAPVPLVAVLPAGTPVRTAVAPGLPDEPKWRAIDVWWREAVRLSPVFELRQGEGETGADVALVLAVDPARSTLTAHLHRAETDSVLATSSFADGDLPAAIDRVAADARTALGDESPIQASLAECISADPEVALAVADAAALLRDGGANAARRTLSLARRRDGASPAVLDGLAALALLGGDPAAAERLCTEALGYRRRLAPTVEHRLARTLLLAHASRHPERAATYDAELLRLAETTRRERPHDLHVALTEAIAHDFLSAFDRARPLLESLRRKEPDQPIVAYHLGWACLGTGDPVAAMAHFEAAAQRLPMPWTAVPRAIACFQAGRHDELEALFRLWLAGVQNQHDPIVHEVRRMQAAHALLTGRLDDGKRTILEDLQWLAEHPTVLERRAGELAETAAVFVRLGGGPELRPLLAAVQQQLSSTAIADACAFAEGMVEIARTREPQPALQQRLDRGGDSAFGALLAAFAHEVRGEVQETHAALAKVVRLTDTPMTKALLAICLRKTGDRDHAERLLATLRGELLTVRLRRTPQHPILGPELAFAYRAE